MPTVVGRENSYRSRPRTVYRGHPDSRQPADAPSSHSKIRYLPRSRIRHEFHPRKCFIGGYSRQIAACRPLAGVLARMTSRHGSALLGWPATADPTPTGADSVRGIVVGVPVGTIKGFESAAVTRAGSIGAIAAFEIAGGSGWAADAARRIVPRNRAAINPQRLRDTALGGNQAEDRSHSREVAKRAFASAGCAIGNGCSQLSGRAVK